MENILRRSQRNFFGMVVEYGTLLMNRIATYPVLIDGPTHKLSEVKLFLLEKETNGLNNGHDLSHSLLDSP